MMEEFDHDHDNDPKSIRHGFTNTGFKRCVDVGWKIKFRGKAAYPDIYTVIDINHEGHDDVYKVKIIVPEGKFWYAVSLLEIYSQEEYPEYYL